MLPTHLHTDHLNSKTLVPFHALLVAAGIALQACAASTADVDTSEDDLPTLPEFMAEARRARGLGGSPRMTREERKQVLDILRIRGVRTDNVIFYADNAVLVEGDMLVDGPAILREGPGETKKGYFWSGVWPRNVLGNNTVQIVPHPSYPYPDWDWLGAFFQAADDFTQKTNVNFTLTPTWGAVTVQVSFRNFSVTEPCYMGRAAMYHDIDDPGEVFINTGFNCPVWDQPPPCRKSSHTQLPFEVKRRVAIHELAHSIGFAHTGDFEWIPGTGHASTAYPSVMYDGACLDEEPHLTPTLSEDDAHSINTIYTFPPL